MNLSLLLFLIGIFGFVLNRKNIILMIISIEIMLLAVTYLILIYSLNFDDIVGQTFAIYIISIAGAESAIGLGILVASYRFIFTKTLCCWYHTNNTGNHNISNNLLSNGHNSIKINKRYCNYSLNKVSHRCSTLGLKIYSSLSSNNYSLDPWFVTGLIDGSLKSLIVWGTNLTSLVGSDNQKKKKITTTKKKTKNTREGTGLLLSNGWLTIATKKKVMSD